MAEFFEGKWRLRVQSKNAGFEHRFRVQGAASGNGVYPGVPGQEAVVEGDSWSLTLEWNDGAGSGWQESGVVVSEGSLSPLVLFKILRADDNFPAQRDGDFDDLELRCIDLDAAFRVVQRPFALDRGTLTMLPDGIFDASQGVQYMGVRIRNTWEFDWEDWMGMRIGIATSSRMALASQGIVVLDAWSSQEKRALQQEVEGGFVKVPALARGAERLIYFKVDFGQAGPGKPVIDFVAQRIAFDPAFEELTRREPYAIFVARSTYDPASREMVAELPEGTAYLRLTKILIDKAAAEKAMRDALRHPCRREPPRPGGGGGNPGSGGGNRDLQRQIRELLEAILAGRDADPCRLARLLEACRCGCDGGGGDAPGGGDDPAGPGGLGDGPGGDRWCRFKPFHWLPLELEYRIVPNPAYAGQFGPLAFEDPWWKCILILLAVLLAIASLIYDYIKAGEDPNFVIGKITAKSNRAASNVDAAIAELNGSRGVDFNVLEAQGDDRNNGLPIGGAAGGTVAIDRTNNGDLGIADAVLGNVVFKSGARSATTRGLVNSISLSTTVEGIAYTGQVRIAQLAAPMNQPLSQAGDSGSLWVDLASRRPVALNFAGPANDDGTFGIANPIRSVANLFNIHFNL